MSVFIENKKLLSNIAYSGVFQMGNWLIPLLTTPYLIKVIGIDKFGLISFALTFFIYLFTITDYGFNISATRVFAMNKGNNDYLSKYFSQVMLARIVLCGLSLAIMFICCLTIHKFSDNQLFFILSSTVVIGRALLPNWYFQGIEEIRVIAILNFITQIIFLVLLIIFIKKPSDYLFVIFIQGIGSILISFIALAIAYTKIRFKAPDLKSLHYTLYEGFYPFLTTASIIGYTRVNVLMLGIMGNDTITGYYSAVERIIFFIRQIIGTIVTTIYPRICFLTTQGHKYVIKFFSHIYIYFVILIIGVAIFLYLCSHQIILFFIGNNSQVSVNVLKLLSLSLIFIILNTIYQTTMTAYGLNKMNSRIILFCFVISCVSNYFLIMKYSIYGAATSVLITEFFVLLFLSYSIEIGQYSLIRHGSKPVKFFN